MAMEFSSNREKYFYHFISNYLDCVVVSFLHILLIFNILEIKWTKLFSKVSYSTSIFTAQIGAFILKIVS